MSLSSVGSDTARRSRAPGASGNTSPRSRQSGGLHQRHSDPARPERRPVEASKQSLQACVSSSPLLSSFMSKDIPQVGPIQWGWITWQNGFAERLIGSMRRECVDHFIALGEAHLRRILRTYARYYNALERTGHWIKMRRSLVRFGGSVPYAHARSLADFTSTTSGFRFAVQTAGDG